MKFSLPTLCVLLLIVLVLGCRKKDAGIGGECTIEVNMKHHADAIDNGTVYILYGSQDAPGSIADYNNNVEINSEDGIASFPGLQVGEYYLYGTGYDDAILEDVEGGLPIIIKSSDVSPIPITLQVTEDGH